MMLDWIEKVAILRIIEYVARTDVNELSKKVQTLTEKVLTKTRNNKTSTSTIQWLDTADRTRHTTYFRMNGPRKCKEDALDKSKGDFVARKADKIELTSQQALQNVDDETDKEVFRKMAKRRKLEVFEPDEMLLTIEDIAAIRNYCGLSSMKL